MRVGFDYHWTLVPDPDREDIEKMAFILACSNLDDVKLYMVTGVRRDDHQGDTDRRAMCQDFNDTTVKGMEYRPVYISNKPLIRRFESGCGKAKIINALGITLMFDDDLIQVACMRELCPDCLVCYVQPQLQRFDKDMGLFRDLQHYVKLPAAD